MASEGGRGFSPAQLRRLKVRLKACEATVLALRPRRGRRNFPFEPGWVKAKPKEREISVLEQEGKVIVKAPRYVLSIDKEAGLLGEFLDAEGRVLVRGSDLAFSPSSAAGIEGASVKWRKKRKKAVIESEIRLRPPRGRREAPIVKLTIDCLPGHVLLRGRLGGAREMERAMLILSLGNFGRWQVGSAEGLLDGWFWVRHTSGRRGTHGIYWRPQGTDVFWQSEMTPLDPEGGFVRLWKDKGEGVEFRFPDLLEGGLDNVMLLDKFAGRLGPHLGL
ncbi:MAG TPA: hypothetical protein EYP65_04305, partial [Armatimonadetes bacterium]|nr:hypothetical protein [Armatimonadota bacterium]